MQPCPLGQDAACLSRAHSSYRAGTWSSVIICDFCFLCAPVRSATSITQHSPCHSDLTSPVPEWELPLEVGWLSSRCASPGKKSSTAGSGLGPGKGSVSLRAAPPGGTLHPGSSSFRRDAGGGEQRKMQEGKKLQGGPSGEG